MCGLLVLTDSSKDDEKQLAIEVAERLKYRGPDSTHVKQFGPQGLMVFHRLSVMDLTHQGDQPFSGESGVSVVCNGEIYNWREIRTDYEERFPFVSHSDCEVLIPLLQEYGLKKSLAVLDGEYAFVGFDPDHQDWFAARDPLGIRPLFYGYSKETGEMIFASEVKALMDLCEQAIPFPPGHYYQHGKFHLFHDTGVGEVRHTEETEEEVLTQIRSHFSKAVEKRLYSDAPMGFLLSGGLDSSLVCAIAAKVMGGEKVRTFSVGVKDGPIDTKYAQIVADDLGTDHTEVLFEIDDVFQGLADLIYRLETFDVTTVRASIGMDMVCRYIRDKTDIKVVMTGEVSDELFGYKYTDFAPSASEFQKEAQKRVRELYMYDVLRADRCISSNSLEARVPFSDKSFVSYVMGISPKMKMNHTGIGKYLLRKAFDDGSYLPHDILYREKAAFSDAQGHAVVDFLKAHSEEKYSDQDLLEAQKKYTHAPPMSKEALWYREIFESFYPGKAELIKDFWMPNKSWENCDVDDPSARVLPNYGKSGE